MKKTILALALVAGITSFAGNTKAAELVQNGDFATGDLTGWNAGGAIFVLNAGGGINPPPGDSYYAFTGNDASLSQTLATITGDQYILSFVANNDKDNTAPNAFISGSLNGVGLFTNTANLSIVKAWTQQSYNFTATSPSTVLQINMNFFNAISFGFIDNISVQAVPEPSTYALFGLGALALVIANRVRSQKVG